MLIDTNYQTEVYIPFGQLKDLIYWCNENCTGKWGYTVRDDAGYMPGLYKFKFEEENDLVKFILKAK